MHETRTDEPSAARLLVFDNVVTERSGLLLTMTLDDDADQIAHVYPFPGATTATQPAMMCARMSPRSAGWLEFGEARVRVHLAHLTDHADRGASVVDQQLNVHGVLDLLVADASVMPDIPRAQTNLPAMMIGYRAAEFLGR
jgi:choline dehydrogenase-like flavoprotein